MAPPADPLRLASSAGTRAKVRLLREFDPRSGADRDVLDPYYGGPGGFDEVLDLVQAACVSLLQRLRAVDAETVGP
jgi:protein-tyrosine phosphatase